MRWVPVALLASAGYLAWRVGGEGGALRAMVGIEQKAIDHYLRLIHQLDDPRLKHLFMEHLVDEEFHAAWAQEMIVQARRPQERDRLLRAE